MQISALEKKLLHYTGKAIHDYAMIKTADKVLVCLSGGKDSYGMLSLLRKLQQRSGKFSLHAYTLDQSQPGWDSGAMQAWLEQNQITYTIETRDTYSIVKEKIPEHKTYCSLCSRLRRGNIYRFASENGFDKIALGHHRDDVIETLLMSIFYNGEIKSMPPKLRSDRGDHIVIRPLILCQETDLIAYAKAKQFPLIPCNLCGSQDNLTRLQVKRLIRSLAQQNEKIPSNILHACSSVKPSQLMDKKLWDFTGLSVNHIS